MKKFLFLSLILLCTAMSAWSYTSGTVTLSVYDADSDTGTATDPNTDISVKSTEMWVVGGRDNGILILEVPFFYVVTGVSFECDGRIMLCDKLVWNAESNEWVQANGALTYYSQIFFQNDPSKEAKVYSVTITYHKHDFNLYEECYHEGVAATCTTPGMMEYWECSECGHIYSNNSGLYELSRTSLEIPAINHKNKIYVEAKPATDTEDGYTVDHWHCPDCGKNFADEECTEQITENVIIRAKSRDWLCFTTNTDNSTVELDKVGEPYEAELEYTTTETTWVPYTFGQTITLTDAGDRVFFRNASDDLAKGFSNSFTNYYQFVMTGSIAASGNVMSLLDKTCNSMTFPANGAYCFACLFSGCESLTSAPELPAMTLAQGCYYWMFNGCTGLSSAPELPAMTLAYGCYQAMYDNCTGLKQVPALPATTMETFCYAAMFRGCTSLTEAPELSATTLEFGCYSEMFSGCTSLETAPELPVTTLQQSCYDRMFYGCTSLTTAPELPATTLPNRCYDQMFSGCTKLSQVKVAFTEWTNNTTYNWLNGVASTGTFVCPIGLDKTKKGASYIPEGWTICSPITISAAGMATLCLPFDAVCSEGVTAFYATAVDNEGVTFSPVNGGLIKADEGVLVKGDAGSYLVEKTTGAEVPTTNYMVGVTSETECPGTANYILVNGSEGVGFYRWDTGSLAAYKAYLPVHEGVTPSSSIAIRFDDGSTTIDDVISEPENEVIYDLQGRRVMNADKGLYIVNGKKVLKR